MFRETSRPRAREEGLREKRAQIATLYRDVFDAYIAPAVEAARDPGYPEAKRKNMRAAMYLAAHLHEAPVHLFVAGWTRRGAPQSQALFPAIQNVLLACRAVGLGASLTTAHRGHGEAIDQLIGLDPIKTPSIALIPIGWPRDDMESPRGGVSTPVFLLIPRRQSVSDRLKE